MDLYFHFQIVCLQFTICICHREDCISLFSTFFIGETSHLCETVLEQADQQFFFFSMINIDFHVLQVKDRDELRRRDMLPCRLILPANQ